MVSDYAMGFEQGMRYAKPKWIPVSEELPEEEKEVLCQLSDGSMMVLYMDDDYGHDVWVDGMMGTGTYDVVAWMPLPEPYEEGEEEEE